MIVFKKYIKSLTATHPSCFIHNKNIQKGATHEYVSKGWKSTALGVKL